MNMDRLAEAGAHFHKMEELHREVGDTEVKLTQLSARHLRLGAAALLDALADFIAGGVLLVGALAVTPGVALARGIARQTSARALVHRREKSGKGRVDQARDDRKAATQQAGAREARPRSA
jgi:hypothetical protein